MKSKVGKPGKVQRVFLSYALEDREAAAKIRMNLMKRGMSVWDAFHDVPVGENFALKVGEALKRSDAMIALVSPAFAKSPWTAKEVEYALTQPRFEVRLVTLMVRPTRSFPWILEKLKFIRATADWEIQRIVWWKPSAPH